MKSCFQQVYWTENKRRQKKKNKKKIDRENHTVLDWGGFGGGGGGGGLLFIVVWWADNLSSATFNRSSVFDNNVRRRAFSTFRRRFSSNNTSTSVCVRCDDDEVTGRSCAVPGVCWDDDGDGNCGDYDDEWNEIILKETKELYSYHIITGSTATKSSMNDHYWRTHENLKHENLTINN